MAICIPIVGIQAADAIANRLVRVIILAVVGGALFQQVWLGVLGSLTAVPELSRLKSRFSSAGVCMQTTPYTCGPAAAVTALTRLGYPADESSIALKAETGRFYGTDEFRLAEAMNQTAKGLDCHVVDFRSVDELRGLPPVLVIINLTDDVAHYIVILKFDGKWAECADPLAGIGRRPREALERDWTARGIICDRR
jgi:predicted double-glycine peptidase